MSDLLDLLKSMADEGYGVAWSFAHQEFRPFEVDAKDDTIEWWHDPEGCGSKVFATAVCATHEGMLRQLGP